MASKKTVKIGLILFILSQFLFQDYTYAELQSFGPVSFNLPIGWGCQTKENNLICLDNSPVSKKNSAIVLNYKYRTAEDSLAVYRDQLSRPRTLYDGEIAKPSIPQGIRDLNINGITWIEGIHLGSEMTDYYTLYYVTVVDPFAILMSLSIEKSTYKERINVLKDSIYSLKINVANDSANNAQKPIQEKEQNTVETKKNSSQVISNNGFSLLTWLILGVGLASLSGVLIYALKSSGNSSK